MADERVGVSINLSTVGVTQAEEMLRRLDREIRQIENHIKDQASIATATARAVVAAMEQELAKTTELRNLYAARLRDLTQIGQKAVETSGQVISAINAEASATETASQRMARAQREFDLERRLHLAQLRDPSVWEAQTRAAVDSFHRMSMASDAWAARMAAHARATSPYLQMRDPRTGRFETFEEHFRAQAAAGVPAAVMAAATANTARSMDRMRESMARAASEGAVRFGSMSSQTINDLMGIGRQSVVTAEEVEAAFGRMSRAQIRFHTGASTVPAETGGMLSRIFGRPQELRHLVAIPDELMRGQRGAVFSSLGSMLRDAGIGATALASSFGTLGVALGAIGIQRMVTHFGDLAEKTRTAAAAAGMSVQEFSLMQRTMQLVTGDSQSFSNALGVLSQKVEESLTDPMSKARGAFATLGIGADELAAGLRHPAQLLELLRAKFEELGPSMQRTAIFRELLGRGFAELVPWLNLTAKEMEELQNQARATGSVFDEQTSKSLAEAAIKSHELSEAVSGLGISIAGLAAQTGLTDFFIRATESITHFTQELKSAEEGWGKFFDYVASHRPSTELSGPEGLPVQLPGGPYQAPGFGDLQRQLEAHPGATFAETPGTTATVAGVSTLVPGDRFRVRSGVGLGAGQEPALADILAHASATLPPGYSVEMISGFRPHGSQSPVGMHSQHALGLAGDFQIIGPQGPIPPTGADVTGMYGRLAQSARAYQQMTYPEFDPYFRWGGTFGSMGGPIRPGSPADLEHFDIRGFPRMAPIAVRGTAAAAAEPMYDPSKREAAMNREIQALRDSTRQKEAIFDQDIAKAGANKEKADKIAIEKAQTAKQAADKEIEIRERYAGAVPSTIPEVAARMRTGEGEATARATAAQTQQIRIKNQAEAEGFRQSEQDARIELQRVRETSDAIQGSSASTAQAKIAAEQEYQNKAVAILDSLAAKAKSSYQGDLTEFKRIEAEKESIVRQSQNRISQLRRQGLQEELRDAGRTVSELSAIRQARQALAQVSVTEARIGGGTAGDVSKITAQTAQEDARLVQAAADEEVAAYQKVAQAAGEGSEVAKKAEMEILRIRSQAAREEVQDFEKAYQAWQKQSQAMNEFFSSLGSAMKSGTNDIIKALLSPQVEIIHAGLTTIRETHRGQQIRQAIGNMLLHAIQSGVDSVEAAAGKMITNWLAKAIGSDPQAGVGGMFSKMLGIGTAAPKATDFVSSANVQAVNAQLTQLAANLGTVNAAMTTHAGAVGTDTSATTLNSSSTGLNTAATNIGTTADTTRTTTVTTNSLITGMNTTATASNTLATQMNTSSQMAGGFGGFLKGIPLIGGLFSMIFSQGGIVPSAGGGMVVGGIGGTLGILHAREMVLPEHLSTGIQNMINTGGPRGGNIAPGFSGNINYAPTINTGRSTMSRNEFSAMLGSHVSGMIGEVRNMVRRGWRP